LEREDPVASRTWLILVVSDLPDGKIHGATLTQEPVNDRSWRRGYYQDKRWDRKKRAQGETNRVMSKHLAHKELLLPAYESQFTSWEKKNASHARRLLLRRQRWYHFCEAAQESSGTSSSSSSSSSDASENET